MCLLPRRPLAKKITIVFLQKPVTLHLNCPLFVHFQCVSVAPDRPAEIWGPEQLPVPGSELCSRLSGFAAEVTPKSTTEVGQRRSGGGQAGSFWGSWVLCRFGSHFHQVITQDDERNKRMGSSGCCEGRSQSGRIKAALSSRAPAGMISISPSLHL